MPLFLCPNDNSQMQKITREGVDVDICPTCKGVWLDRGELDKLLVAEREEAEKSMQAHRKFQEEVKSFERNPDDWKRTHQYDEGEKRYRYDGDDYDRGHGGGHGGGGHGGRRRRRGGFDFFDIFD